MLAATTLALDAGHEHVKVQSSLCTPKATVCIINMKYIYVEAGSKQLCLKPSQVPEHSYDKENSIVQMNPLTRSSGTQFVLVYLLPSCCRILLFTLNLKTEIPSREQGEIFPKGGGLSQ